MRKLDTGIDILYLLNITHSDIVLFTYIFDNLEMERHNNMNIEPCLQLHCHTYIHLDLPTIILVYSRSLISWSGNAEPEILHLEIFGNGTFFNTFVPTGHSLLYLFSFYKMPSFTETLTGQQTNPHNISWTLWSQL